MATVTVRDTLTGSTYQVDASLVLRTRAGSPLDRSTWAREEEVREQLSPVFGVELWAPATDDGEPRYLPVELVAG